MMHAAEVIALGFRYPTPTSAERLAAAADGNLRGASDKHMRRFVEQVSALDLGEWEELHTATLDLSPLFVPYVGHVEWGENYRRGEFMADLKAALAAEGVDLEGELPDHIEPLLRYLAVAGEPLADLVEVFPSTVATMHETLRRAAPDNPYCDLLAAAVALAADLRPLSIGDRR